MSPDQPTYSPAEKPIFGQLLFELRTAIHLTQRQAAAFFHTSEDNTPTMSMAGAPPIATG